MLDGYKVEVSRKWSFHSEEDEVMKVNKEMEVEGPGVVGFKEVHLKFIGNEGASWVEVQEVGFAGHSINVLIRFQY